MYKNIKGKWTADLGNGRYKNPILFSDYSDPDVIRVGDDFFMTASSFTYFPGLPVLHSKDLVNWRIISYAIKRMPYAAYDVPQHGRGVWAPAIRYRSNKFYIYFASPDEGIFMVNTEDPFGEWSDAVIVREAKGWIDPCPFWDEDGSAYLIRGVARSRCGLKSMLFLHRMSDDGTRLLDDGVRVFDGRVNHPTIEGPKMYKRDGYYYILSPAGGVRTGWQMAARSRNIYGPYEHRILMHRGDTPINGPHQGGLVDLENGESWFIHFQDLETYGRVTHLQPARWVDGWPEMGIDTNNDFVGEPVLEYAKPEGLESKILMPLEDDDFSSDKLGLQWQWQAHEPKDAYKLTGSALRLFALPFESKTGILADTPCMLCQLVHSPNIQADIKIDININDGDACGIVITGGNYYGLKLERANGSLRLKAVSYEYDSSEGTDMSETVSEAVDIADIKTIYLRLNMEYPGNITMLYSLDGEMFTALDTVFAYNVSRKSWVGARLGIYCVNCENANRGGYADFEYIYVK